MRSDNMKNHLIGQFESKKVLYAILEALGEEMDELTTAMQDIRDKRWINTGEGAQLDGIGEIVSQSRQVNEAVQIPFLGFDGQPNAQGFEIGRFRDSWETWLRSVNMSDPEYRIVLKAKVVKDTSPCTAEDTISSLRFIFDAPTVVVHDRGNAKFSAAIGRRLNDNEIAVAKVLDLFVRAGGVGIIEMEHYHADNYFGFLGQLNAKGFEVGTFADLIKK